MERYEKFIQEHPAQVKRAEEVVRLLAMFAPVSRTGRYSELVQEAVYGALGLTSLFHDRIIEKRQQVVANISAHVLSFQQKLIRAIRVILTLFSHTEVVLEMTGRLFGGESLHTKVIYIVECVKALGRLILLANLRAGAILINGGQFQATKNISTQPSTPNESDAGVQVVDEEEESKDADSQPVSESSSTDTGKADDTKTELPPARWSGRRSGKIVKLPESLRKFDNVSKTGSDSDEKLGAKSSDALEVSSPNKLTVGVEDLYLRLFGELLHILRPVAYVELLRRANHRRKSKWWNPFIISLILEMTSFRCVSVTASLEEILKADETPSCSTEEVFSRAIKKFLYGSASKNTNSDEKIEIDRRRTLFGLYAMRSPLFDKATLPLVRRLGGAFSAFPNVGEAIESMLVETVTYYHRNHFYNSGS